MDLILTIVGLFAGIAVCMATLYSVSQAMLSEGWIRWANLAQLVAIFIVMGALFEREVGVARIGALPLAAIAVWVLIMERRWYKIFPLLVLVFAGTLIGGYVALTPLPGQ